MGYLRKDMVIDALKEDMEDTKKCYKYYQEKKLIEICYNCMKHVIDRLPQYFPESVVEEPRWIPVSERLPEHGKYVLISCEGFDAPSVGKYEEDDIGETFYLSEDMPCEDFGIVVEAWRPLPEPYKESENG